MVAEEGPGATCTVAGAIHMTGQSSSSRRIHAAVNAAVDGTCLGCIGLGDPDPDPDPGPGPGPEHSSFSGMELGLARASGQEDVWALDAEEEEARSCGASGTGQAEVGTHWGCTFAMDCGILPDDAVAVAVAAGNVAGCAGHFAWIEADCSLCRIDSWRSGEVSFDKGFAR